MADCELLKGCPFFNDQMPMESGLGAMYKKTYCNGDNSNCARFMVVKKLGREKVPASLFPNMHAEAAKLISEG